MTSEFQVLWGDLDAFNHVNHTVFVKWIETARVNYFTDCGLMEMFEKEHKGPILAALSIDYHAPVFFPDSKSRSIEAFKRESLSVINFKL